MRCTATRRDESERCDLEKGHREGHRATITPGDHPIDVFWGECGECHPKYWHVVHRPLRPLSCGLMEGHEGDHESLNTRRWGNRIWPDNWVELEMAKPKRCDTCLHFDAEEGYDRMGECHFNPPVVKHDSSGNYRDVALVRANFRTCGQWEQR